MRTFDIEESEVLRSDIVDAGKIKILGVSLYGMLRSVGALVKVPG